VSTETDATTPETGVAGQGDPAPNDDIDTEAFDRAPAPDDDDADPAEAAKAEGEEGDDDADKAKAATDDGEDVEFEGQTYKVPAAVKGALLRQADYTAKTTQLAEQRRALETDRTTWESEREQSRAALPEEHAQVAVLNHSLADIDGKLETFKSIDWDTWRSQVSGLGDDDPNKLKYARYRDAYMGARDSRIDLVDRLDAAKSDLQTKEAERLTTQQEANAADLAKQRQDTGRVLAAEVPGWSAERAVQIAEFMNADLGIEPEAIGKFMHPGIWKMAHRLMAAEAKNATLEKAQKQQQTAANHEKAQTTTPAATTKGTGASARDPSTARGDALGTKEWMRRRNAQMAKRA
jgi:hypothetical protein